MVTFTLVAGSRQLSIENLCDHVSVVVDVSGAVDVIVDVSFVDDISGALVVIRDFVEN